VVIVGIGINCRAQPRLGAHLGRGVAALDEVLARPVSRNAVIGAVAREVLGALCAWERAGGSAA
jgi:biotin-(acetyl-CoA carboxylase) ligase